MGMALNFGALIGVKDPEFGPSEEFWDDYLGHRNDDQEGDTQAAYEFEDIKHKMYVATSISSTFKPILGGIINLDVDYP